MAPRDLDLARKRQLAVQLCLEDVARTLNDAAALGIALKPRHGVLASREGYVLPLADGTWAARTLNYTEFSPEDDDPYEE